MGILYVIATPIGNLEDITYRAVRLLSEADFILCEDTRQSGKLLAHYKISKPVISYHQHSRITKIEYIIDLLKQGKVLAMVSDAGTPGISDPGNVLVRKIHEELPEVKVVPVPGPAALAALASASGLPMDKFVFYGFLPKKGRRNVILDMLQNKMSAVFYESTYRIIKVLEELVAEENKLQTGKRVVVGRELTKKFEAIYQGPPLKVLEKIKQDSTKGEFVVAVGK